MRKLLLLTLLLLPLVGCDPQSPTAVANALAAATMPTVQIATATTPPTATTSPALTHAIVDAGWNTANGRVMVAPDPTITILVNPVDGSWGNYTLSSSAYNFALHYELTMADEDDQCEVYFRSTSDRKVIMYFARSGALVNVHMARWNRQNEWVGVAFTPAQNFDPSRDVSNEITFIVTGNTYTVFVNSQLTVTVQDTIAPSAGWLRLTAWSPTVEEPGTPSCIYRDVQWFIPNAQ